jgi:tRNA nucleotidyltransferase (CCA-adding enzyme)
MVARKKAKKMVVRKARSKAKRVVTRKRAKRPSSRSVTKRATRTRPVKRTVSRVVKRARTKARTRAHKKTTRKPARKTVKKAVRKKAVRKRKVTNAVRRAHKRSRKAKPKRMPAKKKTTRKKAARPSTRKRSSARAKPKRASKSVLRALLDKQRSALRPAVTPPPVVARVVHELEQKLPGTSVAPGGSFAKGTMLRGKHDVDLFVRFPQGTPDTHMSEALQQAVPTAEVLHGSRDYLQFKRGGIVFEVVPVLHITAASELMNVTDMSPLHVAYVHDHLTAQQKDDVRLAKRFAKAAGVYGAESHIRGFSGYVLELLIAHYGTFEKFLEALLAWPSELVIDSAHQYADAHEARAHLNESKLGPLVLVDPLDPQRNAAAAVSRESITKLRTHAAAFLEKPSAAFFDDTIRPAKIRASWPGQHVLFARVKTPVGRQDIVGSQVLALHTRAIQQLQASDFPLLHASWRFGTKESVCWYVLGALRLPPRREQQGPPSDISHAVVSFRTAHPGAYERNGRWYAHTARKHLTAHDAVKAGFGVWNVKLDPSKAPRLKASQRKNKAK